MIASLRYEFVMQWRKPANWIVTAALAALLLGIGGGQLSWILDVGDTRAAMTRTAQLLQFLLPVGYGCLLADRLVRDRQLGVAETLDATPAGGVARLAGKYLGSCAATAVPIVVVFLGVGAAYGIVNGDWAGPLWALAIFGAVMVPSLAFVGAAALAFPLVMPTPLFRVLFVGYWFWGNAVSPAAMPTTAQTLLASAGDYGLRAFFGLEPGISRPDGDPLNALRPGVGTATALLSIALLIGLAVAFLAAARAITTRTTR
jgi:hypothetical protein